MWELPKTSEFVLPLHCLTVYWALGFCAPLGRILLVDLKVCFLPFLPYFPSQCFSCCLPEVSQLILPLAPSLQAVRISHARWQKSIDLESLFVVGQQSGGSALALGGGVER